ncbi:hypothetical protein [Micromonospora sp. DT47]|uniref:hypothetical protein n=1 Tax=Micromonospora sp. DT47 TaxID=3393431 RepID=UPI003CFB94D3
MLALLAILVLSSGCTLGEILADHGDAVDLQPEALVGTWQSGHRRTIGFREDGTFVATDLPVEAFDDFLLTDPFQGRLDGSGRWTITPPAKEGLSSALTLSFDRFAEEPASIGGVKLAVLANHGVVSLTLSYVGNGGNSWTSYVKCTTDCP